MVHVPGNGKGQARSRVEGRPEDFWQASSFGGSFGFFGFPAFGPRWRQEVVAPSTPPVRTQWWSQVRYRDVRHGLGGRLRV